MANISTAVQAFDDNQSLEVNFINNDLPECHDFYGTSETRYDEQSRCCVANTPPISAALPTNFQDTAPNKAKLPAEQATDTVSNVMTYWNMIFPSAL